MANGPLGGFMPTPAAPAQPPQVKLDTTADSRGNFNNFLKSMNGALSVNPPVMAPAMGAMTPNMAPSLSNIDIFNQPVQMMQFGGSAMSGGAFSDAEIGEAIDSFGDSGAENQDDDNIDTSSPDSDIDYTDVFDDDELQQATDIGRATSESTSDGTTKAIENVKFTDLNQNQINEIKSQIDNRNMVALTEEDKFFKDGNLTAAGEAELNKRNAADFQLVSAGQVLPSEYLSASDIFGTGEKNVMDAVDLTKPVADPFDITKFDVTGVPAYTDQIMRGTVDPGKTLTDTSRPFVSFDVGNQARDIQRALEQGTLAEDLDKPERPDQLGLIPDSQSELDQAPSATGLGFASSRDPRDDELEFTDPFKSFDVKPGAVERALSGGLGTSALTKGDIKNIQDAADRDLIARSVQDKSRQFKPSTNVFGFNVPNFLGRGLNALSGAVDRQVMKDITEKGFTPVYDRDGTITGSRDPNTGILMSGMDFNIQERAEGDNDPIQDVIRRPLTPKPEVDPKPDLPPNVIGGTGGQIGSLQPITADTVVASPFAPASSNIQPISFDSGELNKLIELLTGVAARPVVSAKKGGLIGMANGGLIKAVDDFLAAS